MAGRRMIAKSIIDSDLFLEMPSSSRLLYYDLNMRADDEGFVNNPKKIKSFTGASEDDLNLLLHKRFIISFDSGIIVITHWKIHNYIRSDRFKATNHKLERSTLFLDVNNAYSTCLPDVIPDVIPVVDAGEVSKGKGSLGKNKPYTDDFEKIYKLYPNSENKRQTFNNFKKRLKTCSYDDLFKSVENYIEYQTIKNKINFSKNSSNFFGNDAVYEDFLPDEYKKPVTTSTGKGINNYNQRQEDYEELERKAMEARLAADKEDDFNGL